MFTRMLSGSEDFGYEERLDRLWLFSSRVKEAEMIT